VGETEPAKTPRTGWRRRLVTVLRIAAVVAIGYFVIATAVEQRQQVGDVFGRLSWPTVALSLIAALASITITMLAWRAVLTDLGHRVSVRAGGQIYLVGQLGKYLPGSVWAYVLQMELGRRYRVPRSRGFFASLVTTGLGITAGLVIGTVGLREALRAAATAEYGAAGRVVFGVALVVLPLAIVFAHPKVLTRLVGLALRVTRREPLSAPLSWSGVLRTLGWSALAYGLAGVHLWLLAADVAAPGVQGLVWCTGAFALAMTAGVFVVFAPSGIGVREAVIAATLTGLGVPFGVAYGLALASRLIFTVADIIAAGGAAVVALRQGSAAAQPAAEPAGAPAP
jgi:glycosyltransferase 2 family protein